MKLIPREDLLANLLNHPTARVSVLIWEIKWANFVLTSTIKCVVPRVVDATRVNGAGVVCSHGLILAGDSSSLAKVYKGSAPK